MSFVLGLTGSIGMGKSTTAKMFAEEGCDLWDADAAVHALYSRGGMAVDPIRVVFPEAIENECVNREYLKTLIAQDPDALAKIEEIVHPLVAKDRQRFIQNSAADIVVLDIPLLFENASESLMDAVVCVTVSADIQRQRVLQRGTMTEAQFQTILEKQMPNEEKCARSDFVVHTDTLDAARDEVRSIVKQIKDRLTRDA